MSRALDHARRRAASAQAGSATRFQRRWRLIGAGLSNVWRFGDLELLAASGRLLLRGPNGTGKTTALEALVPYLLDLNPARLSAGKARTTSLASLMREGAGGKRRYGYLWLTLAGPGEGTWSFGVRLQYSEGASPPCKVIPFALPGRPLHELKLHAAGRSPLTTEQFAEAVVACRGQLFESEEAYVTHLAARLFATSEREEIAILAGRLRQVRNPTLLGDVSPSVAADALRDSLPGVAADVIAATAEALAESDATREAFAHDREAAQLLADFRAVWCAHASEVAANAQAAASEATREVGAHQASVKARASELETAASASVQVKQRVEALELEISRTNAEIHALEEHQAYRDAGRLKELKRSLEAQARAASAAAEVMKATARAAAAHGESLRRELENLIEDLNEALGQAASADPACAPSAPLLSWSHRPRAVLTVGDLAVDPGPELVVHGDAEQLRSSAASCAERAAQHARDADAGALALSDHRPVEALQAAADEATKVARELSAKADGEASRAERAQVAASAAAQALLGAVRRWTNEHAQLAEPCEDAGPAELSTAGAEGGWSSVDLEPLADAEPGQILAACDGWARHAQAGAARVAAALRSQAGETKRTAARLVAEARAHRTEANELRSGRLLPLPRPAWSGPGNDNIALGAALEWQPSFQGARARALLEGALAAAGLLGASLTDAGAGTHAWSVSARGPGLARNLSEVLAVDSAHPLAASATAVLARIGLLESAVDAREHSDDDEESGALAIGRDGTFRIGNLHGRLLGADDPAQLAAASHVGAHPRRTAAWARAAELEQHAQACEVEARVHDQRADELAREAEATSAAGESFPSREPLRSAESHRAELARSARAARDQAHAARLDVEQRARDAEAAREEWSERTRGRGLPIELDQLMRMRDFGAARADTLRKAAVRVRGKLAERLERALAGHVAHAKAEKLGRVEAEAKEAARTAADTKTAVDVLEETAGAAIAEVLTRHELASRRLSALARELDPARAALLQAGQAEASAHARLDEATRQLAEAQPKATHLLGTVRALLEIPGVADAVLDGECPAADAQLLNQLASKLEGRKTMAKKTVRERADAARAKLAGIWSLDPGEDHGELLTYVLTHRDASYTPTAAAAYAETLRQRAEQALAGSEERALREFVIGRLPSAISSAWTRLQDWVAEVNRKMRSAAASSGVGVQVRIPLRDDLTPAARDVHELSCLVSDAERTPEQQRRLGDALSALLSAAEGDAMQQRVAGAVNVRDWVEVHYEVTRPGGKTQRWSSKTGLSGGERRLVVIAPMLAAIAAAYDRFGDKALRLVALDEVPAEVDDRGREGLARYLAELDLDLVCTSYLWDGCPGAWDGIDAHDLEAGPDGTVVAFPMLVRGLHPIPEVASANGASAELSTRNPA